jgi:hypothetical protein
LRRSDPDQFVREQLTDAGRRLIRFYPQPGRAVQPSEVPVIPSGLNDLRLDPRDPVENSVAPPRSSACRHPEIADIDQDLVSVATQANLDAALDLIDLAARADDPAL